MLFKNTINQTIKLFFNHEGLDIFNLQTNVFNDAFLQNNT